jgi:hypothetical protein
MHRAMSVKPLAALAMMIAVSTLAAAQTAVPPESRVASNQYRPAELILTSDVSASQLRQGNVGVEASRLSSSPVRGRTCVEA